MPTTIYTIQTDRTSWQTNSSEIAQAYAEGGHKVTAETGKP